MPDVKDWKYLIGGNWRDSGDKVDIRYPYNHEVIGSTWIAGKKEIEDAVKAAESGFLIMKNLAGYKRFDILRSIAHCLAVRKEDFAETITLESGKPIKDSRAEVERAINTFTIASEETKRISGDIIPLDLNAASEGRFGIVRRFPIGPILGITPFNFPLNLVAHKVAPALASGNSIVLKPANRTPLTSLLLAEVAVDVGVPTGAFNVIITHNDDTRAMVEDERFKALSFTGGTELGWHLKSKAGKKKVLLELGGNAAAIIDETADLAFAAKRCTIGAFYYSGQSCISVQRIYIHKSVYDSFISAYIDQVKQLKAGDPMDDSTDVGPLITEDTAQRVEHWVELAKEAGAKVLIGGKRNGSFYEPTVIENVPPDQPLSCQEAFGPVATVEAYDDFDDAIAKVNSSNYGLQTGIFSNRMDHVFKAFNELVVGQVIANDAPTYRVDHMPYGGVKDSGFGREGLKYTIEEMTELKMLAVNIPE